MTAKKETEVDQRVEPDPDFDFKKEEKLDKTVVPVGRPVEEEKTA